MYDALSFDGAENRKWSVSVQIRSISCVNIRTPFTFSVLAARDHFSQRERQGSALKYCELPESGDNALYLPHLGASLGNEGMGVPPLIPGFSRKMRGFLPPFPNITYIL